MEALYIAHTKMGTFVTLNWELLSFRNIFCKNGNSLAISRRIKRVGKPLGRQNITKPDALRFKSRFWWKFTSPFGVKGELVWPNWIGYVTHLSHLLTVFNSSANFFIYLLKHPTLFTAKQPATSLPGLQVIIKGNNQNKKSIFLGKSCATVPLMMTSRYTSEPFYWRLGSTKGALFTSQFVEFQLWYLFFSN